MGYYKSDEERIEQLSEEVAEAERKIDDLRDEVSAQTARAEEAEASLAEREALLHECNAVCLCGCPESEHESYGEDGESCGHDDHECLRVPRSVLAYVETLRRAPVRDEVREAAEICRSLPPSTNEFNVAVANLLAALAARGGA